jgi:hypothetical protein
MKNSCPVEIPHPSQIKLSKDPTWSSVDLDASIDSISKAIRTQFDEEFKKLLDEDRERVLVSSRKTSRLDSPRRPTSLDRSYLENQDISLLSQSMMSDALEFFQKIMRCKTALDILKSKVETTPEPQRIREVDLFYLNI